MYGTEVHKLCNYTKIKGIHSGKRINRLRSEEEISVSPLDQIPVLAVDM